MLCGTMATSFVQCSSMSYRFRPDFYRPTESVHHHWLCSPHDQGYQRKWPSILSPMHTLPAAYARCHSLNCKKQSRTKEVQLQLNRMVEFKICLQRIPYGTRCKYCRHTSGSSVFGTHFNSPLNATAGSPEHSSALCRYFAAFQNFKRTNKNTI